MKNGDMEGQKTINHAIDEVCVYENGEEWAKTGEKASFGQTLVDREG